jgi:hypothetical protein
MLDRASPGNLSTLIFMIPGAHLRNGKLMVEGGADQEPLIVVDGIAMDSNMLNNAYGDVSGGNSPTIKFLNSLSPRTIDFIEVLNGPEASMYGVRGGNGVIIINTLTTPREIVTNKQNFLKKFYPLNYSSSAAFIEPDYSRKEVRKNGPPDKRSTIYWSGPVFTDENGKASIQFFTADPNTTYTVTIKGITATGDIFLKRFSINRK